MTSDEQTRQRERDRILKKARAVRDDIEQQFLDIAHWNTHVRKPDEEPIDPDPDGVLRKLQDRLTRMLAADKGYGPIPPIFDGPTIRRPQ